MQRKIKCAVLREEVDALIIIDGLAKHIEQWYQAMLEAFEYIRLAAKEKNRAKRMAIDAPYAAQRQISRDRYLASPKGKASQALGRRLRDHNLRNRIPPWADFDAIEAVYAERAAKPNPKDYHVDHIIPLIGKCPITKQHIVSGLHTAANLQVLTVKANLKKSCYFDFFEYNSDKK